MPTALRSARSRRIGQPPPTRARRLIIASLEAVAEDGPDAEGLREAVRAHAVDTTNRYETAIGTVGFDANGDSIQQMMSFFRVDPEAEDGAGDWALIKQQDFGPQP